jgi:hypothetical protein
MDPRDIRLYMHRVSGCSYLVVVCVVSSSIAHRLQASHLILKCMCVCTYQEDQPNSGALPSTVIFHQVVKA